MCRLTLRLCGLITPCSIRRNSLLSHSSDHTAALPQITDDPQYAWVARGVLDYMMRDMTHPEGGIFSAEVPAAPSCAGCTQGLQHVDQAVRIIVCTDVRLLRREQHPMAVHCSVCRMQTAWIQQPTPRRRAPSTCGPTSHLPFLCLTACTSVSVSSYRAHMHGVMMWCPSLPSSQKLTEAMLCTPGPRQRSTRCWGRSALPCSSHTTASRCRRFRVLSSAVFARCHSSLS